MKIEVGKAYCTRNGRKELVVEHRPGLDYPWRGVGPGMCWTDEGKYGKIMGVSDPHDLIAEWIDEPDHPVIWAETTDLEKGAILLAEHKRKDIEKAGPGPIWRWEKRIPYTGFRDQCAYRVRPPEPVRETVTRYIRRFGEGWLMSTERIGSDTHRITFPVVNCEVPTGTYTNEDGERIVVERVND